MKRILDIGDLGATYVEHDTPIVKPPIYKPKPPLNSGGVTPSPNVTPPPTWTPPRGGTTPNRPRPSPAPPSPQPSPEPAPPLALPETQSRSNALPWIIGAMSILVAGSFAWAIRHEHTPGDTH